MRRSWRRRLFRVTHWTSVNRCGSLGCNASRQRTTPLRKTTSCCLKSQLDSGRWSASAAVISNPATKTLPSTSRCTSRSAPSINNCANRGCMAKMDFTDKAPTTRGSCNTGRAWASSKATSRNSSVGSQPVVLTMISPMRTGCPRNWLAYCSIGARHRSMCGKITACNAIHAAINRPQAATSSRPSALRARICHHTAATRLGCGAAIASSCGTGIGGAGRRDGQCVGERGLRARGVISA